MSKTYRTPKNPGFIAGVFWKGRIAKWLTRLVWLELVTCFLAACAYHEGTELADPYFPLLGLPIYAPWKCFVWFYRYFGVFVRGSGALHHGLQISLFALPVGLIVLGHFVPDMLYKSRVKQ